MQTATPSQPAVLVFGVSNTQWGNVALPLLLDPFGFAGCSLLVSFDVSTSAVADANGAAAFPFLIPALPSLLGTRFFVQGVASDLAWSDGASVTIGH